MIDRGLRYLIHEHRPSSSDPGRCAVCLSPLDCAPHLPIAPASPWPDTTQLRRIYRANGNRYREAVNSQAPPRPRAAGQGGR